MSHVTSITLQEAIKSKDDSLYVLNNSDPRSAILLSVSNKDDTIVTVAPTWIPIDLVNQCPREELLRSPNFRRMVESELLLILDTQECENVFKNNPLAQQERKSLIEKGAKTRQNLSSSRTVQLDAPSAHHASDEQSAHASSASNTANAATAPAPVEKKRESVSPRLRTMIDALNSGTITEAQMIESLSTMKPNKAERMLIASTCQSQSVKTHVASNA